VTYTQEQYEEYCRWISEEYPDLLPGSFDFWVAWNEGMDKVDENRSTPSGVEHES
jgi:hypothetical protein